MVALVPLSVNAQDVSPELIKNGDFELNPRVQRGTNATTGWDSRKPVVVVSVDSISADNPHYAVICCDTLYNEGFDGINVSDSANFDLSVCLRNIPDPKAEKPAKGNKLVIVQLVDQQGTPIAEKTIRVKGLGWQKFDTRFASSATCAKARFAIVGIGCSKVAIDKVSLKKH